MRITKTFSPSHFFAAHRRRHASLYAFTSAVQVREGVAVATGSPGPTGDLQRVPHPEPPRSLRWWLSGTSTTHAGTDTADGHRVDALYFENR